MSFERRRQLPWAAVGVVLIVGCALTFAAVSLRTSPARLVLVAARALPAGHVLSAADLQTAPLDGQAVLSLPAAAQATVLGRPLAVPLLAGSLLTPTEVGRAAGVSAGQAVVALALKAGQYPPMLSPGDQVQIVDTTAAGGTTTGTSPAAGRGVGSAAGPVAATVLAVDIPPAGSAFAVVASLQVSGSRAAGVASLGASGQGSVVLLAPGSAGS